MSVPSRLAAIAAATLLLTSCARFRGPRVSPADASAVAAARAAIVRAAQAHDLDALLRHVAPGARLIIGADTLDLRAMATTVSRGLEPGAATRVWMAGSRLRPCDRWVYETGGELGYGAAATRGPQAGQRYLYALTWTTDAAGNPLVQTAALVKGDYGLPSIEGCRPTAKDLFERRRAGIALMAGAGVVYSGTAGAVESGMRLRGVTPEPSGPVAGFQRRGTVTAPVLVAAWVDLTPRIALEAVATLATSSSSAFGLDSAAALAVGSRLDQRWAAVLALVRWADVYVGAGPAFVREAWHVSVERIHVDPATANVTLGAHLADGGNTLNRIGLLAQGRITVPISSRTFVQLRAYSLLLPSSHSPAAYAVPAERVRTSRFGLGLLLGAGL